MIVIVGAGLVGLAVARELALHGASVRVLESGEPGKAASWAGAGMLAPDTEDDGSSAPMRALCGYGLDLYPEFVADVAADSGIDPKFRCHGALALAQSADAARSLKARVGAARGAGVAARWLSREQMLQMEPACGHSVLGAALFEREGFVDNRRLGRALRTSCERRGVAITSACGTVALECDERRVRGVRTPDGFLPATLVVNAAGAWAGTLGGIPARARVPVYPVKGQMLALAMPRGLVRRALRYAGGYVVPRDDGRLLVGATVENAGFDVRVTAAGVRGLLDCALEALPALRDLAVSETWAGLRPGSEDGLPYIGWGALEGYMLATGHFRNGILLAPATARLVADLVIGRPSALEVSAFSPLRADAAQASANRSA